MDYSSADSELLASLDFLIPPVKRVRDNTNNGTSANLGSHPNNTYLLKDFRKKLSNVTEYPPPKIHGAQSSTSLILKRTTTTEILHPHSVLNSISQNTKSNPHCTPDSKEKLLIKVTVTPKQITTPSNLRKRKYLAKKIQTTKSSHENFGETKNVYLVLPGSKKEKVYQIKTTGSAKLAKDQSLNYAKDKVIPIEQLSSLQLVLDSLNMENRREKSKKRKQKVKSNRENFIETSGFLGQYSNLRECTCSNTVRGEISPELTPRRSFVRITGHLGLTQDDRYVLRCAATVNDKPVATNFSEANNAPITSSRGEQRLLTLPKDLSSCIPQCCNDIANNYCQKRDSIIQTDLQNVNRYEKAEKQTPVMLSKESQATQADFNMGLSLDLEKFKNSVPYKDEIIQCYCTNAQSPSKSESDSDSNDCQNPLVIISVYPDCCENVKVVENRQNDAKALPFQRTNMHNQNSKQRPQGEKDNTQDKSKSVRSRSRSPSPNKHQNKNRPIIAETKVLRMNTRKTSPHREEVATAIQNRQPAMNKNENRSGSEWNRGVSPQLRRRKETKGTITDHNITKKNIVDNYTKKLTAFMNNGNAEKTSSFPKTNPSKVTINIDGDNEFYDVLFLQGPTSTDLQVKKTTKGFLNKRTEDVTEQRLKNNLKLSEQPRNKAKAVNRKEQLNDAATFKNTFSRLQVRDSLEISHRHDTKTGQKLNKQASKNNDEGSEPFSAPIKHYRGDSCPIPDPLKRDKEIRTLLGVDKGAHTSIARDSKIDKKKFAGPLHYFYNNKGNKKIVTGINLVEMPPLPPCVCCGIKTVYVDGNPTFKCGCLGKKQEPSPELSPKASLKPSPRASLKSSPKASLKPSLKPSLLKSPTIKSSHRSAKVSANVSEQEYNTTGQEKRSIHASPSIADDSPSPVDETPSPVDETPSPVDETPSPVDENPSPVDEYPSPVDESPSPVEESPSLSNKHVDNILSSRESGFPVKSSGNNNTGTQYETQLRRTSLYQQLILNRNIQVFLQVEQFSKQKPIILSRKQYDKVKRTIENTIANKTGTGYKQKKCICKTSLVSVGDVRRKTKTVDTLHYDKQSQTDKKDLLINSISNSIQPIKSSLKSQKSTSASQASKRSTDQSRHYVNNNKEMTNSINGKTNEDEAINASLKSKKSTSASQAPERSSNQSRHSVNKEMRNSKNGTANEKKYSEGFIECECAGRRSVHTMVQYSKIEKATGISRPSFMAPKQAVSTMEIRYTNLSFNHVMFSSTSVLADSTKVPLQEKESHSIHTVFKGRRKCHTPNLGTSVYSLYSQDEPREEPSTPLAPRQSKRKPFLRRLISCLVMRSAQASDLKNAFLNTPEIVPSVDSSIDSYHINTSLGAIDMTSSIYDTSASFYTNHSVYPLNSKLKRSGFFNSVREFLTSRKN